MWEDASNKIAYSERRRYFQGGELDSVMNYPLRDAILGFLNGGTAEHFAESMECIRENYPRDVFYNLLNVVGTHDTARALTLLGVTENEWKMDRNGRAHYQLPPDRLEIALRRLRMAAVIQFTMPGSPTIYYGDEAGQQGFEDPFNRRTYPWGHENQELLAFYRKLCEIRAEEQALADGDLQFSDTTAGALLRYELPSPKGDKDAPTQALVFDSFYDSYRGIIAFVSVKNGTIKPKDKIRFMATGAEYEVTEVGVRTPKEVVEDQLNCGDVGWVSAAIKNIEDVRVGDTITVASNPASKPLSGYREMHPMVYCGLYPVDNARYDDLKEALSKLKLNDAALHFEPETSQALGFGFRCGFLGLLHMDVVEERLEREYNLSLIATSPSVIYHVYKTDGIMEEIDNPSALPEPQKIDHIEEPYVKCDIMVPKEYVGPMMDLCQKKRGEYVDLQVLDDVRMMMVYQMPLSEIIYDFFDKMKSCTKGYASFDYEFSGYRTSSLVKMDILLNGQIVDALSTIVFRDFAYNRGNAMAVKLKDLIPKQQFEIPVQAAIGGKIIARTNIKALRKNVLAKCYGGDISRKKKLLEKQKEGKKRMKMVGSVEIPQEAFMAVLSMDDD